MTQSFILGGYTKRDNKGIHSIEFNEKEGKFTEPKLISELNGPTFVGLSKAKDLLFAIDKKGDNGGISAFKKNSNNEWAPLASGYGENGSGCYVSYRESSQTVYVANYHSGVVEVFKLDGEELTVIQAVQHTGSSVHENQQSSHVHYSDFNADQSILFVCDLGTDIVSSYDVAEDGTLTLSSELKLTPGTGPRHLVLHPSEPYAYIIGELANTTTVVSIDAAGNLAEVETQTNIAEDKVSDSAGAAIRITNDGRFLYVSTRFHNVITVYAINEDGSSLSKVQEIDTHGEIPRDFNLDATEKYALVAHQDTDHLSVFERNAETGQLTFIQNDTAAPECVCIASA